MRNYYLLPATMGDFHRRLKEFGEATKCQGEAIRLSGAAPENNFLPKQIAEWENPIQETRSENGKSL
jgi:hypothetical protein